MTTAHLFAAPSHVSLAEPRGDEVIFTGALREFPGIDPDWPEAKLLRAHQLVESMTAIMPDFRPSTLDLRPDIDQEDFWEDAARIEAAHCAAGDRLVIAEYHPDGGVIGRRVRDSARIDVRDMLASGAPRLGSVRMDEEPRFDPMLTDPAVLVGQGRASVIGALDLERPTDLTVFLAKLAERGHQHAILKRTRSKRGVWRIPLGRTPRECAELAAQAVDAWDVVRLEGLDQAWQAQEYLPMEHEYRLNIVAGQVITAAGCVEQFTPLDARPSGLDSRTIKYRRVVEPGEPSPVVDDAALAWELLNFGMEFAAMHGGTLSVDVAMTKRGPVVVEGNSLSNAGLYATDPRLTYAAWLREQDRKECQ